jgi:predicted amidophosphoribosyltransferase
VLNNKVCKHCAPFTVIVEKVCEGCQKSYQGIRISHYCPECTSTDEHEKELRERRRHYRKMVNEFKCSQMDIKSWSPQYLRENKVLLETLQVKSDINKIVMAGQYSKKKKYVI